MPKKYIEDSPVMGSVPVLVNEAKNKWKLCRLLFFVESCKEKCKVLEDKLKESKIIEIDRDAKIKRIKEELDTVVPPKEEVSPRGSL
jgi:hypothetical protein